MKLGKKIVALCLFATMLFSSTLANIDTPLLLNANAWYHEQVDGLWNYVLDDDENAVITGYKGLGTALTIPGKLGGKKVVTIGMNAFFENETVKTVKIPSTITTIENSAFESCTNLTSIVIPPATISIGDDAFQNCSSLQNVTLNKGLKVIGETAFNACVNLTSITIPDTVTTIGNNGYYESGTFESCTKLKTVKIGSGVTIIPTNAFRSCTSLENITIGSSVKTINESAFRGCTALKKITIPPAITKIDAAAFMNCFLLENVTLSKGLLEISELAFLSCVNLPSIVIPNTVTTIGSFTFASCTSLYEILIPHSVVTIDNDTFKGCPSELVIKGYAGSAAEKFALEKKINFVTLPETPSTSIVSQTKNIAIGVNQWATIGYTVTPSNTTDAVTWKSSADNVVYVNQRGDIRGTGVGTAVVRMTTMSGKTATCTVQVTDEIKINKKSANIGVGENLTLTLEEKEDYFTTSDKTIATVTAKGVVTAKKAGVVTITANTATGAKATCKVTVKNAPTSLKIKKPSYNIKVGKTDKLTFQLSNGSACSTFKITSNNPKIATVSSSGTIKGITPGTATITMKTYNGKTASVKVTISK